MYRIECVSPSFIYSHKLRSSFDLTLAVLAVTNSYQAPFPSILPLDNSYFSSPNSQIVAVSYTQKVYATQPLTHFKSKESGAAVH